MIDFAMAGSEISLREKISVKKFFFRLFVVVLICYLLFCFSQRLPEREAAYGAGDCKLYYVVNVDGMKGLGHSMLLLVDAQGEGTVLSFNGMQGTLREALLGRAGVGKLSVGSLNAAQTAAFLDTGDLDLEGDQLKDNYDTALFRTITQEEYQTVMAQIEPYIQASDSYERLYAQAVSSTDAEERAAYERELERMGQDASLPLYQLYTHNCDHAARAFAAAVDTEMEEYNTVSRRLTPNGNFKAFARRTTTWGIRRLGENSLKERILDFLMVF